MPCGVQPLQSHSGIPIPPCHNFMRWILSNYPGRERGRAVSTEGLCGVGCSARFLGRSGRIYTAEPLLQIPSRKCSRARKRSCPRVRAGLSSQHRPRLHAVGRSTSLRHPAPRVAQDSAHFLTDWQRPLTRGSSLTPQITQSCSVSQSRGTKTSPSPWAGG